jgi:hypothetical protein
MSRPSKTDTRRPWGTRITDFKFGSTPKRHPGKVNKKRVKRQKRHDLAKVLDKFRGFATRVLRLPMCESEDTDDAPLPAASVEFLDDSSVELFDEAREVDSDDESEPNKLEQFEETTRGINFTLTPDIVEEYMDRLDEIGPTPSIESRK